MIINYTQFLEQTRNTPLESWAKEALQNVDDIWDPKKNGHIHSWIQILKDLPNLKTDDFDFNQPAIRIGKNSEISDSDQTQLEELLKKLHPWRKGPFDLFGIQIDTEWRSDWKWDRLQAAISPLQGRTVLDVGCGNGYHCFRMGASQPKITIGIDPYLLFNTQFKCFTHFLPESLPIHLLPLGLEDLPLNAPLFDTIFSMGVLYHRKSPIDHLAELKSLLSKRGELVLETLTIEGGPTDVLVPQGRYAKMRNVWFLPSVPMLELWLRKVGFRSVEFIDTTPTSTEEQRPTEWMTFESLPHYLNPNDSHQTIEGYPAPQRSILIAKN